MTHLWAGTVLSLPDLGLRAKEAVRGDGGIGPHAAVLEQRQEDCGRKQEPPRARDRVRQSARASPQGASATLDRVSALLPPRGPLCMRGHLHKAVPTHSTCRLLEGPAHGVRALVQTPVKAPSL